MLNAEDSGGREIPEEHIYLVKQIIDRKHEIEFGYFYPGVEASAIELVGARAYQRAVNRIRAEENRRIRDQHDNQE